MEGTTATGCVVGCIEGALGLVRKQRANKEHVLVAGKCQTERQYLNGVRQEKCLNLVRKQGFEIVI